MTHVLYSFANVNATTGEVYLSDNWADIDRGRPSGDTKNLYGSLASLYKLKKNNRQLKTLLSIGGASYSPNFAGPAGTASGRAKFAQSAVQLLMHHGFDGLDIDWEFPSDSTQAANYLRLMQTVRAQLSSYSKQLSGAPQFLLTAAVSAGPDKYNLLNITALNSVLDMWNLMAYDYSGPWDKVVGHQANLFVNTSNSASTPFNSDYVIKQYIAKGASARKMILGMPLYGRQFAQATAPGKAFSGTGSTGSWEAGIWDYKVCSKCLTSFSTLHAVTNLRHRQFQHPAQAAPSKFTPIHKPSHHGATTAAPKCSSPSTRLKSPEPRLITLQAEVWEEACGGKETVTSPLRIRGA